MRNGNLAKAVTAALLGSMVFFGPAADMPQAEAAKKYKSLYEEYQAQIQAQLEAEQKAAREEEKKFQAEMKEKTDKELADKEEKARTDKADRDVERENKRQAEMDADKSEGKEDSAGDFLDRMRATLNSQQSSKENKYSRFLTKPYDNEVTVSGGDTVSVYEPEPADSTPSSYASQYVAEGTYSFNWQGTPIAQSLYALGSVAHKGVIVNGNLTDKVYAKLDDVTVNAALDYLSRAFGFNWMMDGNNIIVSTNDKMLQSVVFNVSYADKDKLKDEFKSLGIEDSNIYVNTESGTVSITGTPYQIAEARKRMRQIDRPVSQCLLAAQLIEISHGKNLDLGFSYTMPSYSHTGTETNSGTNPLRGAWPPKFSFGVTTQAERALSKGKVISRPIVLSRNGETAKINFGDKVPVMSTTSTTTSTNVTVTYQDVGTNLEVTPVINTDTGDISLKINAEVSNITQYVTQGNTRAPQINTRTVNTTAHVKSGESLIIGGLMSVSDLDNLSGIPGLMNLPILGELFKFHHRSRTYAEVYIMLTPFIMSDDVDAKAVARKVEF